jgi:prophage tail gpP-like protein
MASPQEICTVTANGGKYDVWETIELTRSADKVVDHATFIGDGAGLKLAPGDAVTIALGGVLALTGNVYLREPAYDEAMHAVKIGVCSKAHAVVRTTVDGTPGQYLKQNIQQIASACFGKVGVGFTIKGAPAGADLIFARVSETIGQSRFAFIENLCRLRNLHMIDDGKGNIIAYRGPQGSADPLQEGVNILKARVTLKVNEKVANITGYSQFYNEGAKGAGVTASVNPVQDFPTYPPGNLSFIASEAADMPSLQMSVNHVADANSFQTVDGSITVQGWFVASGDLWMNYCPADVTVNSPLLIPGGRMKFVIKEVVHRQSAEEGSTTDILITNEAGLGKPTLNAT